MFYTTDKDDHGLPHNPLKAIISPRPIAWISTLNSDGSANLAPYSFFNGINDSPPMVAFSAQSKKFGFDEPKDTLLNAREQGEFTVSIVSDDLKDAMNVSTTHFAAGVDEFEKAGLEKGTGKTVACPYVAASPASLECKTWQVTELPGGVYVLVIGEVTGVHINDAMIHDGRYDVTRAKHLARLGYRDYARVEEVFELDRPDD